MRRLDFIIGGLDNPYLNRWCVIPRNPVFNIYLHNMLRSDYGMLRSDYGMLRSDYGAYGPDKLNEQAGAAIEALALKVAERDRHIAELKAEVRLDNQQIADANAAIAELKAQGAGVAEGWVVVPREPTEAMKSAGIKLVGCLVDDVWAAILSAAPKPPAASRSGRG